MGGRVHQVHARSRRDVVDGFKKERNLTDDLQKRLVESLTAFAVQGG